MTHRAPSIKSLTARFESTCPGCGRKMAIGDTVASPTNAPDGSNGIWYCAPCAQDYTQLHRLGLGSRASFLTEEAIEGNRKNQAPFHASLEDRRREVGHPLFQTTNGYRN